MSSSTCTDAQQPPLFTFAVIADSHVNPVDGQSSSPWQANAKANGRSRHVVDLLNRADPSFVVHLGDMVHPVPALHTFVSAIERFRDIYGSLEPPLHLVPGNHDTGDKPGEWLPADSITGEFLEQYRREFGSDYFSFDHRDCRFVVINAQLLNSGLSDEQAHRDWLASTLADSTGRRTFLFTHYPPYLHRADEPGHYDNIDDPARSWLLELLDRYGVEAVFSGHVHNFFYNREGGGDHYILPSVAFVRHDYSEFAGIAPDSGTEDGRDDGEKLGFFLVDVYPDGHRVRMITSGGQIGASEPGGEAAALLSPPPASPLGLDARHSWVSEIQIPYSGALDEFARKRARNDYPLLATWTMGVRRLRVPAHDLLDPVVATRMRELAGRGPVYQVFCYGWPDVELRTALTSNTDLVSGLEIILSAGQLDPAGPPADTDIGGIEVFVSPVHPRHHGDGTSAFAHQIQHGFAVDFSRDAPTTGQAAALAIEAVSGAPWHSLVEAIGGAAFTVRRGTPVVPALQAVHDWTDSTGHTACVTVQLAGQGPADHEDDDLANAALVAQALLGAWCFPGLTVNLDTFMDMDRGYFPRTGLITRHHQRRPAGKVQTHLNQLLAHLVGEHPPAPVMVTAAGGAAQQIRARACSLVLPLQRDNSATGYDRATGHDLATADNHATGVGNDGRPHIDRDGAAGTSPVRIDLVTGRRVSTVDTHPVLEVDPRHVPAGW